VIPIPWFNADSKMYAHPKPRQAGLEAMGLWLVCGTYASDNLTDGQIPLWYIQSWPRGLKLAGNLVAVNLWTKTSDGYQFNAWDEYQRTREQVLADREKAKDRQRQRRSR
jgi:hypothetical protein